MNWCKMKIAYNSAEGYCNRVGCNINTYQVHQTIGSENRFSLFIGQQGDECDIKDIGHYHDG